MSLTVNTDHIRRNANTLADDGRANEGDDDEEAAAATENTLLLLGRSFDSTCGAILSARAAQTTAQPKSNVVHERFQTANECKIPVGKNMFLSNEAVNRIKAETTFFRLQTDFISEINAKMLRRIAELKLLSRTKPTECSKIILADIITVRFFSLVFSQL